ncbi:MAG TPA: Phenylacetic acid catabolic protein [Myxococcales bacterium]|nr:Phenylacetic acid catabolic protein [Myxococcales bacterium]
MARDVETPAQIPTPEYRAMLLQLIESQAYRELMAAQLFGHALKHVPGVQNKMMIAEHLVEELEHYECTVFLYEGLGGDVEAAIQSKLSRVPYAETWEELAMVQFLYDQAGFWHLREYEKCSYVPYRKIIGKILEEEAGHEGFGEKMLRQWCQTPANRARAQALFEKWLPISLYSFGRPGGKGNQAAMEMGLKSRDSGAVMQDFLNQLKPAMRACGLTFPPRERLDVELPEKIDLSL